MSTRTKWIASSRRLRTYADELDVIFSKIEDELCTLAELQETICNAEINSDVLDAISELDLDSHVLSHRKRVDTLANEVASIEIPDDLNV